MSRYVRAVAIGYPHHITQRGNNREPVFFDDEDRLTYLEFLNHYSQKCQVEVWAYCLMVNHIHLLAVPHEPESLARGVGLTNMAYTRHVNRRYHRSGRVWQNRFFSSIVDTDEYLWAVVRYIENNPVTAELVNAPEDFVWSSARHHLLGEADPLIQGPPWLDPADRGLYRQFIKKEDKRMDTMIKQAGRSGRSIGSPEFIAKNFGTPPGHS